MPNKETTDGGETDADDFRMASWDLDKSAQVGKIVKQDWFESRFVDYWEWTSEPQVIGSPPDDWPSLPSPLLAALSETSTSDTSLLMVSPTGQSIENISESSSDTPFQFGRVVADYGVDLDGDGRFDQLVIEIQVEVAQAGDYWIRGALAGNFGEVIGSVHLEEGRHTVELPFDGMHIYMSEIDGPYVLEGLWATDVENPAPVDFEENKLGYARPAYQTSPYKFSDFGVAGATLSGDYSHHAVDTDDDGYADALVVKTDLNIEKRGIYTVHGVLQHGQGEMPTLASWTGSGSHVILQFDGLRDTVGPYTLQYLHVRNAADQVTDGMKEPHILGESPSSALGPSDWVFRPPRLLAHLSSGHPL